jgi:RNA polymerase sigma-70 factor, ECF subfamily
MAGMDQPRDVELLRRLTAGDEGAFSQFYRRHHAALYRFALHMTGSSEAAADVVQETFVTLMDLAGKFDEQQGTPAAFLFGIARNHVRKARKRESRYVELPEEEWRVAGNGNRRAVLQSGDETFFDDLAQADQIKRLREAILALPEHYREAVTLCDLEGRSYAEAASLLGCPIGTVRSRLNRARDLLMVRLRPAVRKEKTQAQSGGKK